MAMRPRPWRQVCCCYACSVLLRPTVEDFKRFAMSWCFGFGCRRQQKRHVAAPPPAGVRRKMKRNRQKTGGSG